MTQNKATADGGRAQGPSANTDGGARNENQKRTQTERLLDITKAWDLFHDPNGVAYVTLSVRTHRETWPINSSAVRDCLTARFFAEYHRPPHDRSLTEVIRTLEAKARFQGERHTVARRIARHEGDIYLDLCDADWRAVRVTADGWTVSVDPPARFVRSPGMLPLPEPAHGGTIGELRPFVNLEHEDDWKLLAAWLTFAFRPTGPYPILVQYGGEGTAKSTATRVVRSLIDPNEAPLRSLPRDERDLAIAATNGWVLAFDNVSRLADWQSDALCRIATGSGFATRRLFTDDGEARFAAQRPILMNGIEPFVHREDFLSRTIGITLPRIPDNARRLEAEFWTAFEESRPRILGALLDAVAGALGRLPVVEIERLPRMADFAQWGTAVESALGWERGAFMDAYQRNLNAGADEMLAGDTLTAIIVQLLKHAPEWRGTSTELLGEVRRDVWHADSAPSDFPKTPRALSGWLQRRASLLARAGVSFERLRGHRGRLIVLRRRAEPQRLVGAVDVVGDHTPEVA